MNKEEYELRLKEANSRLDEFNKKYESVFNEWRQLEFDKMTAENDLRCHKWEVGHYFKHVSDSDASFYFKVLESKVDSYICSLVRVVPKGQEWGNWKSVYHPVTGYKKDGNKLEEITEEEFNRMVKSVPCEENSCYKEVGGSYKFEFNR